MTLHIRMGDVELHGHTDYGFLIGPGGFHGWEGAPATRRDAADRIGAHGSFSGLPTKAARLVSLSGTALGTSEADVSYMGDVLAGVAGSPVKVTVTTATGTRWATGSVEGAINFDRIGGSAEASFALALWFADPRKYGETQQTVSTGGDVSAYHRGNTAATPRFTVTGNFPSGYRLTSGTSIIQVGPTSGTVTDTVDGISGRIERGGSLQTRLLQIGNFWTVPGGALQSWRLDPIGGTGTATCYLTDTYI